MADPDDSLSGGDGGQLDAAGPSAGQPLLDQGLRLYEKGELLSALTLWEEALGLDPDLVRAREYIEYVRENFDALSEQFAAAAAAGAGYDAAPGEESWDTPAPLPPPPSGDVLADGLAVVDAGLDRALDAPYGGADAADLEHEILIETGPPVRPLEAPEDRIEMEDDDEPDEPAREIEMEAMAPDEDMADAQPGFDGFRGELEVTVPSEGPRPDPFAATAQVPPVMPPVVIQPRFGAAAVRNVDPGSPQVRPGPVPQAVGVPPVASSGRTPTLPPLGKPAPAPMSPRTTMGATRPPSGPGPVARPPSGPGPAAPAKRMSPTVPPVALPPKRSAPTVPPIVQPPKRMSPTVPPVAPPKKMSPTAAPVAPPPKKISPSAAPVPPTKKVSPSAPPVSPAKKTSPPGAAPVSPRPPSGPHRGAAEAKASPSVPPVAAGRAPSGGNRSAGAGTSSSPVAGAGAAAPSLAGRGGSRDFHDEDSMESRATSKRPVPLDQRGKLIGHGAPDTDEPTRPAARFARREAPPADDFDLEQTADFDDLRKTREHANAPERRPAPARGAPAVIVDKDLLNELDEIAQEDLGGDDEPIDLLSAPPASSPPSPRRAPTSDPDRTNDFPKRRSLSPALGVEPVATSPREERVRRRVETRLRDAQEAAEKGDFIGAVTAVEAAQRDDEEGTIAPVLLHRHRDLLYRIYEGHIGDMTAVPLVAVPLHEIAAHALDHRTGFLLSRIDGMLTFEDILDVAGMPRMEAYQILSNLLRKGVIEVR